MVEKTPAGAAINLARKVGGNGRFKYAAGAAALVAVVELHGCSGIGFSSHIDQGKSFIRTSVGKGAIKPLTLDARAVTFSNVDANIRTQDTGTVPTNLWGGTKKFNIPGTGQIAALKAEMQTIAFVPSTATTIEGRSVSVDRSKILFQTTTVENQTLLKNSLPWGTSIGDGESQFVNGITGGLVPLATNTVADRFTAEDQYIFQAAANADQEKCGPLAESQTEEAMTLAYKKLGATTVSFTGGSPNFAGPYPNVQAPTNLHNEQINDQNCHVSADALDLSAHFSTNNLTHPIEAAAN